MYVLLFKNNANDTVFIMVYNESQSAETELASILKTIVFKEHVSKKQATLHRQTMSLKITFFVQIQER